MCSKELGFKIEHLKFSDVFLLTPRCIRDKRGFFVESFNDRSFAAVVGLDVKFVRDCMTMSLKPGTIRGLHYQSPPHATAKLVSVITGRVRDFVVDIRRGSPTYGQHAYVDLSAENLQQLFIPAGYLHGLVTLEPNTCVMYKMDNSFSPECDGVVYWRDPDLAINWNLPCEIEPILSERDTSAPLFADFKSPFDYSKV